MKGFDGLHIKWNKVKTRLLTNGWLISPLHFFYFLMQISSCSWNGPGECGDTFSWLGKKLLLYSDIQKTRTQKPHVRLSAMLAIYSPGIVQRIKREERNLICTVSSMSITAQLQYCPNWRQIARIFWRPEIKTNHWKGFACDGEDCASWRAFRAKRKPEARQHERCLFTFLLEYRCLIMTLVSAKSSVVALAYDNLRVSLKNKQAETHQFLIIFRK